MRRGVCTQHCAVRSVMHCSACRQPHAGIKDITGHACSMENSSDVP
jgi:hypothetical protein